MCITQRQKKKPKAVYYGAQQWLVTMDSHYGINCSEPPSAQCLKTIPLKKKTLLEDYAQASTSCQGKGISPTMIRTPPSCKPGLGRTDPLIAPIGGNVD